MPNLPNGNPDTWQDDQTGPGESPSAPPEVNDIQSGPDVVGTYVKVITFSGIGTRNDAFVVLYVRPVGSFLFAGYWRGSERSSAAGRWWMRGSKLVLEGKGRLWTDDSASPPSPRFHREFWIGLQHHSRVLTATSELKGWSLLSWSGQFTFVGRDTIIDPDGAWLPSSLAGVDAWIAEVAGHGDRQE